MAEINTKIMYDKEEDILNLSKGKSSRSSIEVGDFIVDIDYQGFVSAIEILNASENLNLSQEILENFDKTSMSVIYKPNYIYLSLNFSIKGKEKEISIPLTINLGHEKVEKEEAVFVR